MKKTVKRIIILLASLLLAFSLTGCMQYVLELDINEDMSAAADIKVGILSEYSAWLGESEGDPFGEFSEEAKKIGFEISDYTADGYTGVEIKGNINNIEDLSQLTKFLGNSATIESTTIDGKKAIEFSCPAGDITNSLNGQTGDVSLQDMSQAGGMDMRFIIKMPYPVEDTNATEVSNDKMTLTWDLLTFRGGEMYATAVGGASFPVWAIILIIVAAAAVVAFFVWRYLRKKQAPNGPEPTYNFDPMTGEPIMRAAAAPAQEAPVAETPVAEVPVAEAPVVEAPAAEEPKAEEPAVEAPAAEEPKAEEPAVEAPIAEEPKAEEPVVETPAAEEPKAEEAVAEEPKVEEPAVEEPKAEEPVAEEPKAEEPAEEQAPVTRFCPNCGKAVAPGNNFCPYCAYKLN